MIFRKASQISFVVAGSLPLFRMLLRTQLCKLSSAFVVVRIFRTGAGKAKNGMIRSQWRRQLWATVGKRRPHSPLSNAPSACSAASALSA